jgi:hypothetical protein
MKNIKLLRLIVFLCIFWNLPYDGVAATNAFENFDTNWPVISSLSTGYTNQVNTISGWSISNATIWRPGSQAGNIYSPSNACTLKNNGAGWIQSPFLSNGIGRVIFFWKAGNINQTNVIENSYDGSTWFSNPSATQTYGSTSYAPFTNLFNSLSNQYVRIRRLDSGANLHAIEDIIITYPPPLVTLSNLTNSPALPTDQDTVTNSITVSIQSVPDTFTMTNYWRVWPAANWTLVAMTSNSPTLYTSTIPSNSIGSAIEYYACATYTADGIPYATNSTSTNSYLVIPKSSYTNLVVTGSLNAALRNGASYLWQGVIQVPSNSTFNFQGIGNGVTNTWGEANQSITNAPLFGQAEVTNSAISLNITSADTYLFSFNETNRNYSVRSCAYENFNTWTNLNTSTNTPSTNSTGWVLVSGNTSNDTSRLFEGSGRSAIIETNAWLQSPNQTNGISQLSFWYRNWQTNGAPVGSFQIQTSSNAITWTPISSATVSNITSTNYLFYSVAVNSLSSKYIRILNTNSTSRLCLDEVVAFAPPLATVSGVTINPPKPADNDTVAVSASVSLQGNATISGMTNFWREWPAPSWANPISMTSSALNLYTNTASITGRPIGSLVEYYVQATYSADNTTFASDSATYGYVVQPKSAYTNLVVAGQLNTALRNGANYQWQGVIQVTNINPTFQFRGTNSIATNTWGDLNQSVTNIPLYGTADATNNTLTLYTTNNGPYLFAFNETNLDYSVRSCAYENFNIWTNLNASTNTPSTNSTGWVLVSGNTSNDTSRLFEGSGGSGRSAIIETNGWLQTPYLSNGVGQVSLWYRNWQTTGASGGKFQVQVSTNAVNWDDLANGAVSNIISTNYLFFSVTTNYLDGKYIRILNTSATTRLCLDEVVIAQPGAGVSGISATPTTATILAPITIAIDVTSYNGASISNVIVWYRVGTNVAWESAAMTSTNGSRYSLTNQFIGLPVGTLYYAIQCEFSGFQAQPTRQRFILGDTNSNPASVTVTDVPLSDNYRFENFDTNWPTFSTISTTYTNLTKPISGWSISNATIWRPVTQVGNIYSSSNACTLKNNGAGWIQSPLLSNGIGSVIFFWKAGNVNQTNVLENSYDGSTWFSYPNATQTYSGTSYAPFTNFFNSLSNQYVRIRRLDSGPNLHAIEDINITYPPANVIITNIFLNPGYPVAGQTFTASCDVVSSNPYFPAYNIRPKFNYWPVGGITSSIAMDPKWILGITNHFSIPASLGSALRDTPYGYNVSVTFDGYCGNTAENQSPKTNAPSGTFTTRAFSSNYTNISVSANATTLGGRLLTNGLWRDIITAPSSNSTLSISLKGYGYSVGNGWATSTNSWGNSSNWQTSLPLADTAYLGETNISFTGTSNSQYVVQFNELTGEYIVQQCVWQDWENWGGTSNYVKKASSELVKTVACNFDTWSINTTRTRAENFSDIDWTNAASFSSATTPAAWGTNFFQIYGARINSSTVQIQSNAISPYNIRGWISQLSYDSSQNFPLRGLNQITYSYKTANTNTPCTLGVYLFPTNLYADTTSYYNEVTFWRALTNFSGATNTTYITNTLTLKTNTTFDVIFSHDDGAQMTTWNYLSVSEWYADTKTNDGWIAYESWIETRTGTNNCCRFDPTRADGTNQYIRSPLVPNGINSISFSYCGADTNTIKFDVETSKDLITWTLLQSVTASTNSYATYTKTVTNLSTYVRINSKTVAPGILLIDDISLAPVSKGSDWVVNNTFINADDTANPPLIRQYYGAAAYLNSNRTAEVDATTDISTFPYIQPPPLPGIGDISFWYRNWATNGTPAPTRVAIQTSVDFVNWTTVPELAVDVISNTADYCYYSRSIYDTNSQYVRILNIDTNTPVGRVCFDDILITTPLASSLSISNMTLSPSIPLIAPVKVSADVYGLFYNPSNIILTLQYATGSTYSAAMIATPTNLVMKISSNNPAALGKWFEYTNSIPAFPADTYVKYQVLASFTGTHSEVTSPRINNQFLTAPTWYAPLQDYTNNLTYYIVLACPTNAVWFNEFNVIDDPFDSREKYIEVCGPSSLNLSNWIVQMFSFSYTPSASYRITNGALANSTNSFGFWVIGDTNTVGRNMTLTNSLDQPSGGFRLVRPSGIYADAIAYGTESAVGDLLDQGFRFTAEDDPWSTFSVALTGTGNTASAFTWINWGDITPGRINTDQHLLGESQVNIPPPIVSIDRFWVNTNVWIICTATNTWYPAPWYTTNLISSNSWAIVPTFSSSMTPSNALLWFSKPISSGGYFYKVVVTNN